MTFEHLKAQAERVVHETATDPWWFLRFNNDALMKETIEELVRVAEMRLRKAAIAAGAERAAWREVARLRGEVMELELQLEAARDAAGPGAL